MAQVKLYRPIELPYVIRRSAIPALGSGGIVDAANEEVHFTGYVVLEDPSGGAKTISSAGGKIHWRSGAVTFANASTIFNIGIQDTSTITSPSQGDGTFDVSAQLVGVTDTLVSNMYIETPMESGSKSISHGQLISIGFQLQALGGADSLVITTVASDNTIAARCNMPASTLKTAGTFAIITAAVPNIGLEFDDGTIGWLLGAEMIDTVGTVAANVDTATADEYGNFIQIPGPMMLYGVSAMMSIASDTSDFEVLVYSDPLGSPTLVASRTIDATQLGSISVGAHQFLFNTPVLLQKDTPYAFTLRPTTTGSITYRFIDMGDAKFNKLNGLDGFSYSVRRLDNAGAFSDYNANGAKTRVMQMSALLQEVANDSGSGAGGSGFVYIQS